MLTEHIVLLSIAVSAIAFLYACVGHAGASGYIAVMTLAGLEPTVIKPTGLMLNVLVASIATWQFLQQGHFSWRLFWPFAALAVPMAFCGGYFDLQTAVFKIVVGLVLLVSSWRFLAPSKDDAATAAPPIQVALPIGAAIGLLAGFTGTGGGVFLTPLLLMMRWATTKVAAGVSALFVLVNSVAGLLGNFSSTRNFPSYGIWLAISVVVAGYAGASLGSRRLHHTTIRRLLAVVLLVASVKLLLTAV